ncbi:LacI family DNA-binding transcriptional regulator [Frondihabitans australicus]|uniref:LacI family transcriptional regulator n=1 Tax=Frondihabitans australicus TaxID=386892 RepID=A0A495IEB2_9MICO|nr:LacI family DNA-binding transcriptional regulator [Frondihabitans australicus]RKR74344.1 LacI family transcriptional regulator [Frondihabitans australicus]
MTTPVREGARRKPATITDVARSLGLAPSTVSRALATPERVNAATRARIVQAAAEIGYVPARGSKAAAQTRARAIAVLVSDITNPFYFDIIRGTQMQLKAAGYTQLLVDTEESGELEAAALGGLLTSADGAIITASRLPDADLATFARRIPLVAINRRPEGVPNVLIDTPGGIGQALEHLASLGHRDIVYVSGPPTSWSNERRWKALERAAERFGIVPRRIGPFSPTTAAGVVAADAALNSGATGCIVFNDLIAIGMLQRLRERGVDVPGRLSIVGCDDIFGADFCNPPLTTLHAPIQRAGQVAVSMLLAKIASDAAAGAAAAGGAGSGDEPSAERRSVLLPTTLTVRSTTGPAPAR